MDIAVKGLTIEGLAGLPQNGQALSLTFFEKGGENLWHHCAI
nr:hypothetical protein [Bacillus infantis]